jgi:hypothetical protein
MHFKIRDDGLYSLAVGCLFAAKARAVLLSAIDDSQSPMALVSWLVTPLA